MGEYAMLQNIFLFFLKKCHNVTSTSLKMFKHFFYKLADQYIYINYAHALYSAVKEMLDQDHVMFYKLRI